MRKALRNKRPLVLVLFIFLYIGPAIFGPSDMPSTILEGPNLTKDFAVADVGEIIFTEHGSKEYLGNGQWRYRSSVGETNAWDGSKYVRYIYDLENKQVTIGKLTFMHGPDGVITINHSESGNMIGALKWYAQYYFNDVWQNFTFDNYEFLGATQNEDNATVYQRWWSANGELNVSYTYYYWNELKMRAQATNLAAQAVPVRVLWALVDIRISPDYTLIIDEGVAVGVELGNEQQIFWHDVTQGTPEIAINPVLDKDNRRAAVVFGNMSSVLGQYETMDIDPTYTVAADTDDDYWLDPFGTPSHILTSTTILYINRTTPTIQRARGQFRVAVAIDQGTTITDAYAKGYEIAGTTVATHYIRRIDETNVGSLEGDSSIPDVTDTNKGSWSSDTVVNEWSDDIDITDMVQDQVNLVGWSSGYYIGFGITTEPEVAIIQYSWEDYQAAGTNHAYIVVEYIAQEGEYNYVDQISDLYFPSDIGTHSDFAEMQDFDSNYDTLTEADIVEIPSEWKYVDSYSDVDWAETGSPEYIDAQDQPTNYITGTNAQVTGWCSFADTSGYASGSNTFTVNLSIYYYAGGDDYVQYELDWTSDDTADASGDFTHQGSYAWQNTGTISGLDTVAEINQLRVRLTGNKGSGGPDASYVDAVRIGIAETGTNYELDLEVGWVTADYDETNEELCIYGGTQGSEALRVDVYSSGWVNVITDLQAGWNNVSVSSYLTDATFEIRFTDTNNESTLADAWEVEAVLLHTWTPAAGEQIFIFEVIDLSDTTITSVDFSTTVSEVIGFFDTVVASASFTIMLFEQILFSESVSVGVLFLITVFEVLGLAATVSVSAGMGVLSFETIGLAATTTVYGSYSMTINELIDLTDLSTISAGFSNTIFETIGLLDHVTTNVSGANEYYVTVYEVIGLSESTITSISAAITVLETIQINDLTQTTLSASITVFEIIGLADVSAAYRGFYITIFEVIELSSSMATTQLIHYYVYEVIGVISSIGVTGGAVPTIDTGILYQLFLSTDMWGCLGPAFLVIGGYIVAKKDKGLGVIYFIVECLVVAHYLTLVEATPFYWWNVYIILLGGIIPCGFFLQDK